jgi:hypothetical protein
MGVTVIGSSVTQFGRTRVAAPTSCSEIARAAAIYVSGTGSTGPTTVNIVPYGCESDGDCVDPLGAGGRCSGGRCSFTTGPCARDSGVDSGVDASSDAGDANFVPRDTGVDTGIQDASFVDRQPPPFDQGVVDVGVDSASSDAATDGASSDSSATGDAGADASSDDAASMDVSNADGADGAAQAGDSGKPPSINGGACQCRAPATPSRFDARALVLLLVAAAATARLRRRS